MRLGHSGKCSPYKLRPILVTFFIHQIRAVKEVSPSLENRDIETSDSVPSRLQMITEVRIKGLSHAELKLSYVVFNANAMLYKCLTYSLAVVAQ